MKTVDEVLDFAISEEQKAHDFYQEMAAKARHPEMKAAFEQFAQEELGHKRKLQEIKAGKTFGASAQKVTDLKIADYLVDVAPDQAVGDYQQALIFAMKKEKAAFKLYSDLAKATLDRGLKEAFLALAQEEAKHKLRFEVEYDEVILAEN
jgi:rubrerythrin